MNAQLKGEDFVSEDRLARVESEVKEARTDLNDFKVLVTQKFGEITAALERLRNDMGLGDATLRGDMNAGFEKLRSEMGLGDATLRGEMNTGFEKLRGEMNAGFEKIKRWALVAAGSMIVSAISILGRIFKLW